MKYILLIIAVFVLLSESLVYSQPITWQRSYVFEGDRTVWTALQLQNGNYFMSGPRYNGIYGNDIYIIDKYGNLIITKNHNIIQGIRSSIELKDSCIWLGGDDILFDGPSIFKLSKNYDSVWIKEYGISTGTFNCLKMITDSKILAAGDIYTNPTAAYVTLIDTSGIQIWQKIIDSVASMTNLQIFDIAIADTNNIYLLCRGIFNGRFDPVVYKINSNGQILVAKRLYTLPQEWVFNDIIFSNNSVYIGGRLESNKGYLVKLNNNLDTIFYKIFNERLEAIVLSDVNILVSGSTTQLENYPAARLLDANGNELWYRVINNAPYWTFNYELVKTKNKGYFYAGNVYDSVLDRTSPYALVTDSNFTIEPIGIINYSKIISDFKIISCYPNPFNNSIKIKFNIQKEGVYSLKLYDCTGKLIDEIFNKDLDIGEQIQILHEEFSNLSSAVYFIKLSNEKYTEVKKIILIK